MQSSLRRLTFLGVLIAGFCNLSWSLSDRCFAKTTSDLDDRVIYQIITDRFVDGDPTNNDPPQSKGLFDPEKKNWQAYWGGDLCGIQSKIDYLKRLGVGAVWISPVPDCVNKSVSDTEILAPYHGYWPRDFRRCDEHFGDATMSWKAFDALVAALHASDIKLIVDFVPNHSNPLHTGEKGALYSDGKLFATPQKNPDCFHMAPSVTDWNNPDQLQHYTVFDLADLNQNNRRVDRYLKGAARLLQEHGADAFRIDSMKHVDWNWFPGFVQSLQAYKKTFVFGEWFQSSTGDPTYGDSAKVANESRMSVLDYPLAMAIRRALGNENAGFPVLKNVMDQEDHDFASPEQLVTFIDNHDVPRFQSLQPEPWRLHQALVFLLTSRGIPCIYYGTEQYLHNDTDGGKDPYDRPMMNSFAEDTEAFNLIKTLSRLRKEKPVLVSGSTNWLRSDADVCVYERVLGNQVAVVALNKSDQPAMLDFSTRLPEGNHPGVVIRANEKANLMQVDRNRKAHGALRAGAFGIWIY